MNSSYTTGQGFAWYYATRDEASRWPLAPGNMLVFFDPDGQHFYVKSLGWSPYEGVKFEVFTREKTEEIKTQEPAATPAMDLTGILSELGDLKAQMAELINNAKHQQYYKKGDNKQ